MALWSKLNTPVGYSSTYAHLFASPPARARGED
jgi:hypothetical protein